MIQDRADVAWFASDLHGQYIDVNVGATALLGWSRADFLHMTLFEAMVGEGPPIVPLGRTGRRTRFLRSKHNGPILCDLRVDSTTDPRTAVVAPRDPYRDTRHQIGLNAARRAALDTEMRDHPWLPCHLRTFCSLIAGSRPELLI